MLAFTVIAFVIVPAVVSAYAVCVISGKCSREEEELYEQGAEREG